MNRKFTKLEELDDISQKDAHELNALLLQRTKNRATEIPHGEDHRKNLVTLFHSAEQFIDFHFDPDAMQTQRTVLNLSDLPPDQLKITDADREELEKLPEQVRTRLKKILHIAS